MTDNTISMDEFEIYVVNVFSDRGINGGNQLGVIAEGSELTTAEMQNISKQLNYSESTFVTSYDAQKADVRIFLPDSEIHYAGHPTVGTAYVLMKHVLTRAVKELTINLKSGSIQTFLKNDTVYMEQLPPNYQGKINQQAKILDALNLSPSDLVKNSEFSIYQPSTLKFLYILLGDPNILENMDPDLLKLRKILNNSGMEPYIVTPGGIDGGDFHCRFFAPGHGINEDPATGSAQAGLMEFLDRENMLPDKDTIIVEQGYEMGRPSKIYNQIEKTSDGMKIYTGGRTHTAIKGVIYLKTDD